MMNDYDKLVRELTEIFSNLYFESVTNLEVVIKDEVMLMFSWKCLQHYSWARSHLIKKYILLMLSNSQCRTYQQELESSS